MPKDSKAKILGLQKNVFFLGLTSLFNDLSSEMIVSIFPAFFTSVLKSGAASLGLVEGIAEGASNIIKIYSGYITDKYKRRKPLIVVGYAISVLTRPFYVIWPSVADVLGLRFADRIGKGLRDVPRDTVISLSVEEGEMGQSFGYHRAMDTLGAVLGPLTAYFILSRYPNHFNYVFITAFVVGLIALASLYFISDVVGNLKKHKIELRSLTEYSLKFKLYLLSIFIMSLGSLPVAVMLLKTESVGLMVATIPLFYMVYNISYAGFSFLAGRESDKVGSVKVIIAGYVFLLLGYIVLNYSTDTILLVFAFLLLGLFPAFTDGVQRSYAAQITEDEKRGGAFGLFNAAVGLGSLGAGILGGYLWQAYGPSASLVCGGVAVVLGLAIFIASSILREI